MPEKCEAKVNVDDVLRQLGRLGRYQLRTLLLLCLPSLLGGMYNLNYVFTAADVDYRCRIEECDGKLINPSLNENWLQFAAPRNRSRQCYRHPAAAELGCSSETFDNTSLLSCTEWVYETEESIVSEFNLACEGWKRTLVGTVRSIGLMVSLLITGPVSDRLGRKVMICTAGTLSGVLGLAKSFSSGYAMFIGLEFLEAALGYGFNSAGFILGMEFVHKDQRLQFNAILVSFYAFGGVIYAVIAWKVHYWRNVLRVVYPPAILMIFYAFILDESVRWLLSRGKKAKALEIILKAAKMNSVTISNKTLINLEYEPEIKHNPVKTTNSPLMTTLKSSIMMKRFAICAVWWTSAIFSYYGISIQSVSMSGNKYLNFALSSLMEIPSSIIAIYVLSKYGRRKPLMTSFILTGVFCVTLPFIDKSLTWLSLTLFLLGKLSASFTFATIYIYTSELFPTYTRNSMHALCSCVGRVGAILAPQTPLLEEYMHGLPSLLFGSISLLSGLLTLLTPDTDRARLPDNVAQAERVDGLDYPDAAVRTSRIPITTL